LSVIKYQVYIKFKDSLGTFLVEEPATRHAARQVADASPVGEKGHQRLVPIREGSQGEARYWTPGVPHAALRAQQRAK